MGNFPPPPSVPPSWLQPNSRLGGDRDLTGLGLGIPMVISLVHAAPIRSQLLPNNFAGAKLNHVDSADDVGGRRAIIHFSNFSFFYFFGQIITFPSRIF